LISLPFKNIFYDHPNYSLLIRPVQAGDAQAIHIAVIESLKELRPFMDWAHRELSVENQIQRINTANEMGSKDIGYDFSVFDRKTNEYLMSASLHAPRVLNKKAFSIGYWTATKHCNKGLATLLTKVLTIIAFEHFDCDRVEIGCNKANQRSTRVIEKCGFNHEGVFRNYFSPPTKEMIQNDFYPDRTGMLYAIITDHIPSLSWYQTIKEKISFSH